MTCTAGAPVHPRTCAPTTTPRWRRRGATRPGGAALRPRRAAARREPEAQPLPERAAGGAPAALGLVVADGDPVEETARFRPDAVYLSEDVSAYARRRAARLAERFDVRLFPGITIVPPGELAPAGKDHYRVFTPYWRAWRARPLPAPVESGQPLRSADAGRSQPTSTSARSRRPR